MSSDRLTGLDASFLHLEDSASHMHVASVMTFEGASPALRGAARVDRAPARPRAALPPAARLRAAQPGPAQVGRRPAPEPPLPRALHRAPGAGLRGAAEGARRPRVRPALDRDKPLWEIWLVEGLEGDRFAMLSKTHHALVDGISGVDIISVLFDTSPEPAAPTDTGDRWLPRPLPSSAAAARRGARRARHDAGRADPLAAGGRSAARAACSRACATPRWASAPWPGPA